MYPVYSIDVLKSKSLVELKAIASPLNAVATDKRSKQSWIDAIVAKQPQPVEPVKFDVEGDDVVADGEVIASITCDDHLTQSWVVDINGVEIHRTATWAQAFNYVCWHYKQGTLPLPKVGDRHHIGDFLLRCSQVGGKYATVWEVYQDKLPLGEIRMLWNTFWEHTYSGENLFATPQLAVIDLHKSFAKHQEEQMSNIAQYAIYDYHDYEKSGVRFKSPGSGLPRRIRLNNKYYCYLDNPGDIWVEEEEFYRIINSHAPTLPGYCPEKRIWQVYDAVERGTVIDEIASVIAHLSDGLYQKSSVLQWINKAVPCWRTLLSDTYGKKIDFDDIDLYYLLTAKNAKQEKEEFENKFWKCKPRKYFKFFDTHVVKNSWREKTNHIAGFTSKLWVREWISCRLNKDKSLSRRNYDNFLQISGDAYFDEAHKAWIASSYQQGFIYEVQGSGYKSVLDPNETVVGIEKVTTEETEASPTPAYLADKP